MAKDDDDDVPLINNDDDDEQILPVHLSPPMVDAIFVVNFDGKHGNMIEFQIPNEGRLSLHGVEYKALPSGSHHVTDDFVYFRHGTRYGLACLARLNHIIEDDGSPLSTIPQSQRGLRIKSIGILTSSIHNIHAYVEHLQAEANLHLDESTADNDRLTGLLTTSNLRNASQMISYDSIFSDFVQQFGAAIYPLVRLLLLNKRILLCSSPPIGSLCNAIYLLHRVNPSVNSLFFLTIADIPMLASEISYIACVSEKIFKEKTSIYDVFIEYDHTKKENRRLNFYTNDSMLKSIVKITHHDRARLKRQISFNQWVDDSARLYEILDRFSTSTNVQQIRKEVCHVLNLHPRFDNLFLNELIRIHNIARPSTDHSSSSLFTLLPCCCCCFKESQ